MGTNGPASFLSPKVLVGAVAAILIGVSSFLNWADVTGPGGTARLKGTDVGVEFLVDKGSESSSPSILLLLGIAAALIAIGLLVPNAHRLSVVAGGVLALVVVVLYCVQVQRGLDDELKSLDIGLLDFISTGVYVALAGGIAGVVASFMPGPAHVAATPPPAAEPPPATPAT